MLHSHSEEATAIDFFPQVEAGLVPVLLNVGQVIADDRPKIRAHGRIVAVRDQPTGVGDYCSCSAEDLAMPVVWNR